MMWGNRGAGGDYIGHSNWYEQPRFHTRDTNYHPEASAREITAATTTVNAIARTHARAYRQADRQLPVAQNPAIGTTNSRHSR